MVDNSGSTLSSIISCLGPKIFVQINCILAKFYRMKAMGSSNDDTPCSSSKYPMWFLILSFTKINASSIHNKF